MLNLSSLDKTKNKFFRITYILKLFSTYFVESLAEIIQNGSNNKESEYLKKIFKYQRVKMARRRKKNIKK